MVPRREARSRTAMLVSRSSYKISMSVGVEVKVPINVRTKIKHYNTMLADSQTKESAQIFSKLNHRGTIVCINSFARLGNRNLNAGEAA